MQLHYGGGVFAPAAHYLDCYSQSQDKGVFFNLVIAVSFILQLSQEQMCKVGVNEVCLEKTTTGDKHQFKKNTVFT